MTSSYPAQWRHRQGVNERPAVQSGSAALCSTAGAGPLKGMAPCRAYQQSGHWTSVLPRAVLVYVHTY